ncbi:MAG: FKBP-type peptidyl-prolyl cis-trans isomerase [Methanomassiliicoccales archaeon]|nr:MAG: FKBP-type peptidyl-prolyl cis-trans isomerase [Methanomassiliicoccales archaeon]
MEKVKYVALLVLVLILNITLTGCFEEEEEKEPSIEIELIGGSHKIYAGHSTTYILLIKNNQDEADNITLGLSGQPSGWDVTLNQTSVHLKDKGTLGVFLVVNASKDASKDDYKVKIEAESETGAKQSKTITTKVIGSDGVTVRIGDKVQTDYIGYQVDYAVFDTSIEAIAREASIRKGSTFSPHGYQPLNVYVGPTDLDDNDDYITTVEGFWEAVVGMKVGQSRTVVLTPAKGYGEYANATINVTEDIPMIQTFSFSEFESYYPNEEPIEGVSMKHHFWEWDLSVDYVNETEDVVRILNEPYLNQIVTPYGWDTEIVYKNRSDNGGEGRIRVKHYAQNGMQTQYQNFPAEVLTVDEEQIKIKYNKGSHELATEILIFDITLLDIPD